ncbi:MAG: DNA polymerase I, partial [candidate division Zixibacteria bacterium]|nr:DNA polymerase I [candidate division Zixibacteria bacterium]
NSILRLFRTEEPDSLAVVFDTAKPTFRHKMYEGYKATRAKMPEELAAQLPRIYQAVEVLGIESFAMAGYEADDIIGTLACKAENDGFDVWCMTGDKDFFQLVTEHTSIYYPPASASSKPRKMGREEVKEKFGVYPEQVIDKLAMMGDSSDNVPGIPGIGPKTADKLLEQYGSLEALLKGYEQITAKGVRNKVVKGIDSARLSRELVTIKTDVPIECDLGKLKRRPLEYEVAKKFFLEMEFNRLLAEILPPQEAIDLPSIEKAPVKTDYRTVGSIPELKKLVKDLSSKREIAVDTETTSLDPLVAELVGVSLSAASGTGWYVPVGHTTDSDRNLPIDEAIAILKPLLENPKVQKIGQNIKYDLQILRRCGIEINPISFDTMVASFVVDPSARHSLSALALRYFDYEMQPITDLIGSGKKQVSFATVPIDKATFYAAEDADLTYRLRGVLAPKIQESDLHRLYYNIELPLVTVLADMEEAGIRVDAQYLGALSEQMEAKLTALTSEIHKIAGGEFNINSTQQLAHILFDKLGLPTKGKTAKKTGYSTDVRVLEELAELHQFPKLILDYRQYAKLKSTYVDAIPRLINRSTGRVHTSFNQTIATTGRLSSTDPNLQNIPVRTEDGRAIRKAFVPADKDYILLVADYSQIELRILAHYAADRGLIDAFNNAEDIHTRTAAEVYDVPLYDVTPEMRRAAKTANFAIIYGVSAYGLAQQTELDLDGAKSFIDTYFERYPGIKRYIDDTKDEARKNGYVTTMFKRRRYLADINSKNYNARQFAERIAINSPIQGTAAEMIKIAMLDIHKKMAGRRSKMVLQVHDELVFDVYKDELDDLREIVRECMENAVKLVVPITVDLGVGENWLEAK